MKRPPKPRARGAHEPSEPTPSRGTGRQNVAAQSAGRAPSQPQQRSGSRAGQMPVDSARAQTSRSDSKNRSGRTDSGSQGGRKLQLQQTASTQHARKDESDSAQRRKYYTSNRATKEFGPRQEVSNGGDDKPQGKFRLGGKKAGGSGGFGWPWGGKSRSENELSQRRREIQRAHRRRLLRYLAISAAAAAVVVALAAVAFFSPLFALDVKNVKITGATQEVPEAQIRQMVEPYAKLALPRVSTAKVAQSIESLAMVKSAEVTRHWPRGLDVAIAVRQPLMAVAKGDTWEVLDADGVLLREVGELEEGLIKAELTNAEEANRAKAVQLIAGVIPALKGEFRQQVDTLVSDGVSVEIRTVDGPLIKWGDTSDSDFKAQVVQLLMQQRPAQVYDVSTPTRPVTS